MEKISLGSQIFVYPMPVGIVGVMAEGRANFMALAWLSRVNLEPPLLGIALNKTHYSALAIRKTRRFSINFPGQDMIEKTDFVGMVSGRNRDKSLVFDVFFGAGDVPMIRECPLCLECNLYDIHEFPVNDLFIGEIVSSYSEERYLTRGMPDMGKIKPLLLTMPDNGYWGVGERLGDAWKAGEKLSRP